MKNTEENIKKFHNIINSKCPICNQLLSVNTNIFKSSDVGFHKACTEHTSKEDIENLIDDVLDNVYGIKKEIITEGYRDTVLTRIDCGEGDFIYNVEFWNDNKTGFCFGREFDSFEEAFEDFKSKQLSPKIQQVDKSLRKYLDNFDVITEGKDNTFLFRQTCGKYTIYVVGNWGEGKLSVYDEVEFENDFEGAYKYFKSLQV